MIHFSDLRGVALAYALAKIKDKKSNLKYDKRTKKTGFHQKNTGVLYYDN